MQRITDHYERTEAATEYRGRFSKSWTRRLSNAFELRMLGAALRDAGAEGRVLDVPCGAGRLAGTLRRHHRDVTCVDASGAMLRAARVALDGAQVRFARADAFRLPFADATFDVTVCWRLLHHFPDPRDRRRLLMEIRRVTRHAIVLSFWDAGTARARRIARRARADSGRCAIERETLGRELGACGLRAVRFYRLFGPMSPLGAAWIAVP